MQALPLRRIACQLGGRGHTPIVALWLSLVFGATSCDRVQGQAVPDDLSCAVCEIDVDVVVEFGHELGPGMIGDRFVSVFRLPDSRWMSIDISEPGVLRFYDSEGNYEDRLDRYGQGPGEFTGMSDMFVLDEGYLAYDVSLGRLTWLDSQFNYVRSMMVGGQAERVALLPDKSGVVLTQLSLQGAPEGHVLRLIRFDGTSPMVFGGSGKPLDLRGNPRGASRVIAVDHQGAIWSGQISSYEMVQYSQRGDTLAVIRRKGEVFGDVPFTPAPFKVGDPAPSPRMRHLFVDSDGLLWVVFTVAGDEWEDALRDRPEDGAPDTQRIWDSVVEVIDPVSAEVLARTRLPHSMTDVKMVRSSGQVMLQYVSEKSNGFLGTTVLRLSLVRN